MMPRRIVVDLVQTNIREKRRERIQISPCYDVLPRFQRYRRSIFIDFYFYHVGLIRLLTKGIVITGTVPQLHKRSPYSQINLPNQHSYWIREGALNALHRGTASDHDRTTTSRHPMSMPIPLSLDKYDGLISYKKAYEEAVTVAGI